MATLDELNKEVQDLKKTVYYILKLLEEHPRESSRIVIKTDYKADLDTLKINERYIYPKIYF